MDLVRSPGAYDITTLSAPFEYHFDHKLSPQEVRVAEQHFNARAISQQKVAGVWTLYMRPVQRVDYDTAASSQESE